MKEFGTKMEIEIRELGNKVDRISDEIANQIERKTEKTDNTIDRAIYFFSAGVFLKGGLNLVMKGEASEVKREK